MNKEERIKWLNERDKKILEYCKKASSEETLLPDENPDEAAKAWYDNFIKHNIDTELNGCEEIINGVHLTKNLDDIRNNDYETMKCLIIKDNKIIGEVSEKGTVSHCDLNHETLKHGFEKAQELGGEIYIVHNHPHAIAAIPSGKLLDYKGTKIWVGDYNAMHVQIPELEKKHNVKCIDYGIVTPCDYYSAKQKKDLS